MAPEDRDFNLGSLNIEVNSFRVSESHWCIVNSFPLGAFNFLKSEESTV